MACCAERSLKTAIVETARVIAISPTTSHSIRVPPNQGRVRLIGAARCRRIFPYAGSGFSFRLTQENSLPSIFGSFFFESTWIQYFF